MQFCEEVPLKLKLIENSKISWIRRTRLTPSVLSGVPLSHVISQIEEFTKEPFALEYIDDEEDVIQMNSEDEWKECLVIFKRMCQSDQHKPLTLRIKPTEGTEQAVLPTFAPPPTIDIGVTQKKSKKPTSRSHKKRPQNIAKQMLSKHCDGAKNIKKAFRQQLKSMNASAKIEIAQIKRAKKQPTQPTLLKDLPGKYESHLYDGTPHKNDWCYATISSNANNTFTWSNRAGTRWTLYPVHGDSSLLLVDASCPYYVEGHRSLRIERDAHGAITSLIGPRDVVYSRQCEFSTESSHVYSWSLLQAQYRQREHLLESRQQRDHLSTLLDQLKNEQTDEEEDSQSSCLKYLCHIEEQSVSFEEEQFNRPFLPEEVEEALKDEEALLKEQELLARETLLIEEQERKEAEQQLLLEQAREIEEHIRREKLDERKLAVLGEAQEYERDLHLEQESTTWEQLQRGLKEHLTQIENQTRSNYPAQITKLTAMGFSVGPDILDLIRRHGGDLNAVITCLLS